MKKIGNKKKQVVLHTAMHISCTRELNDRVVEASMSKSIPKSSYVKIAVETALRLDGF